MAIEFKLPDLGEDIETGEVINVYVSSGDEVSEEQALMEIETDKAALEIPSPAGGVIKEVHVKEGDTIEVGQLLVTIDDGENGGGEEETTDKTEEKKAESKEKKKEKPETEKESAGEKEEEEEDREGEAEGEPEERAKEEKEEEPKKQKKEEPEEEKEEETAKGDAEEKPREKDEEEQEKAPDKDTKKQSKKKSKKEDEAAEEEKKQKPDDKPERETGEESQKAVPASPTVRRLARERGVDITKLKGTGAGGRITEEDIKNYTGGKEPEKEEPETETGEEESQKQKASADKDKWGDVERIAMSRVRRLTAERLTEAWKAPHVTQHDKADITELEKLRKHYGSEVAEAGGKLTMTSIILKVIASALKVFPQFNATVDMENEEIIYKKYINIGVAVDTDRGLLVPVIRDADKKNIEELSVDLSELSEKARTKKISVEELQGGTFTISNLGGLGGTYFTPVLYAPQVAILGISRSSIEAVYIEGAFLPRLQLPLSLSYDHRLIDGADAVRFLRWVVEALEEPFKLSLEG
ncbi:MAG: dihydrolipoamide acetyltransferase family protein [Deltaproteobacteria bacterium]